MTALGWHSTYPEIDYKYDVNPENNRNVGWFTYPYDSAQQKKETRVRKQSWEKMKRQRGKTGPGSEKFGGSLYAGPPPANKRRVIDNLYIRLDG